MTYLFLLDWELAEVRDCLFIYFLILPCAGTELGTRDCAKVLTVYLERQTSQPTIIKYGEIDGGYM